MEKWMETFDPFPETMGGGSTKINVLLQAYLCIKAKSLNKFDWTERYTLLTPPWAPR